MLDEGARTQGLWLPLALADVVCMLFGVVRMWAASPEKVKVPKRSELLASWCLPMLASSARAAEKEADALALYESVKHLAEKQKQKEETHDSAS